jgi:hypothetical protein
MRINGFDPTERLAAATCPRCHIKAGQTALMMAARNDKRSTPFDFFLSAAQTLN